MADALFESNWQPTKDALCEGLEGNKKTVMETTLENTRQAPVSYTHLTLPTKA